MINIRSGSAVTILNAIKSDYGAAIGINANISVSIQDNDKLNYISDTDTRLLEVCVDIFSQKFNIDSQFTIKTYSQFPPARGMKTSSAISCALINALCVKNNINIDDEEIIQIGAEASINAGVSITGAIDDAYASFLGGVSFIRKKDRKLISHNSIPEYLRGYDVLLLIPIEKNEKQFLVERLKNIDMNLVNKAAMAMKNDDIISAIKYNTSAYAPLLTDKSDLIDELDTFIDVVGLNGGGPSLFCLINSDSMSSIKEKINNLTSEFTLVHTSFRDL